MTKLTWAKWIKENFNKRDDELYYTSKREINDGVSHSDLSHFTQQEVETLYMLYLDKDYI